MPELVNYSEGHGSPIKPNVCLQAASFPRLSSAAASVALLDEDAKVARGSRL